MCQNRLQKTLINTMKRQTVFACLLAVLAAGCSGSDNDEPTPKPEDRIPRQLTVKEMDTSPNEGRLEVAFPDTRATLDESGNTLQAAWKESDPLTCFNLSNPESENYMLTADNVGSISTFSGTVKCWSGDNLVIVYPRADFISYGNFNASYTITLSGQNGDLTTLASNFHYVYGVAKVNSVDGSTANATMAKMKSLLAVCKFSFKEKGSDDLIPVSNLTIGYAVDGQGGDTGTYPQSATVTVEYNNEHNIFQATVNSSTSTSPLTVNLGSSSTEVYVALLPTNGSRTLKFTINDTYTATATANLGEGKYYPVTLYVNKNNNNP